MQIKRKADVRWTGSGKEGSGIITTQSGVLKDAPYSYPSRFGDDKGTNPEELIGGALAGCFSMKLTFDLEAAGHKPGSVETSAEVIFENGAIPTINLHTRVKAEGLTPEKLAEVAEGSKKNCPIGKLLKADLVLKAELA